MKEKYHHYMSQCFDLAKKALGDTSPNPYVGSIIVKNDIIIGRGHHAKAGSDHAEIAAIKNANSDLTGATLICNLEPCCHTNKKTPPCVDAIIAAKISHVVISNLDTNPLVAGKGVEKLKNAGIKVTTGVLQEEGELLNEVFFTNMTKRRPFVHLKWAQTLDGKVATHINDSKWITNEESRLHVHKERSLYDAILVGDKTITSDDPQLTVRLNDSITCKRRIVLNPKGDLHGDYKIFTDGYKEKTLVITEKKSTLPVMSLTCQKQGDLFDLPTLLENLSGQNIKSIYIEGGMSTISPFLDQGLFDRLSIYIAPKLLGPGLSLNTKTKNYIHEAMEFPFGSIKSFGNNFLFQNKRNVCLPD